MYKTLETGEAPGSSSSASKNKMLKKCKNKDKPQVKDKSSWFRIVNTQLGLLWMLLIALTCGLLTIQLLPGRFGSADQDKSGGTISYKSSSSTSELEADAVDLESLFHNYTQTFHKHYTKNQTEKSSRFSFFKKSWEKIQALNSQQAAHLLNFKKSKYGGAEIDTSNDNDIGYNNDVEDREDDDTSSEFVTWKEGMPKNQGVAAWGLTSLADLSPEEFQARYLDTSLAQRIRSRISRLAHHRHPHFKHKLHGQSLDRAPAAAESSDTETDDNNIVDHQSHSRSKRSTLPNKVDWRTKNIISSVKHQKDCGACWAFSTVETVESMKALATGTLTPLSVQQVIDCSKNGNSGCNGGDTCTAVEWMSSRHLTSESAYPTTLKDGSCKLQSAKSGSGGGGGVKVASNFSCSRLIDNEDKMLDLLANHGPVAVAVDATNWQFYVGGVIQWNCEPNVNHAVQIVGYDLTTKPHHYIVRNSWGSGFGDNGYLYIATDKNLCGIATEVVWLSVE